MEQTRPPELDSEAIVAFVMGVVGIVACQLFAPVALLVGWLWYRRCRAEGREPHPLGIVGMALGAAGTLLLVMFVAIFCAFAAIYVAMVVVYLVFFVLVFGVAMIGAATSGL